MNKGEAFLPPCSLCSVHVQPTLHRVRNDRGYDSKIVCVGFSFTLKNVALFQYTYLALFISSHLQLQCGVGCYEVYGTDIECTHTHTIGCTMIWTSVTQAYGPMGWMLPSLGVCGLYVCACIHT